jgi:hypothetical protein
LQHRPKIPNYGGPKGGIAGASAVGLRAQARPPGTEFLDAETGRQKSSLRLSNAHRDKNLRIERPEIPAETPYLASYQKGAVCEDWMVVFAVKYEPVSTRKSQITADLQGLFTKNGCFWKLCLSFVWTFIGLAANSLRSRSAIFF